MADKKHGSLEPYIHHQKNTNTDYVAAYRQSCKHFLPYYDSTRIFTQAQAIIIWYTAKYGSPRCNFRDVVPSSDT